MAHRLFRLVHNERLRYLVVLLIAAIHGTTYVVLVPPWGHYDEPTHFEYAWLIANRLRWPQEGDVDQSMRREVASSMLEHGFYRGLDYEPRLLPQQTPIKIGVSELVHPPLYYTLVALPLRVLRYSDVRTQLYAGRAVSLLLYLASIAIACALTAELFGAVHPLSWTVPAAMALLPSYTDLMTSINNDVGAVVALSLFLWGAVRTLRRGATAGQLALHLVWMALAALACVYVKNTAAIAVLLLPLALTIGWLRTRRRRAMLWLATGALCAIAIAAPLTFSWGNAALWFHWASPEMPTSQAVAEAPLGERALALGLGGQVQQPLLEADVQALQGQVVTLGAWMWSARPTAVDSPSLSDGRPLDDVPKVELGSTPAFHTLTTTVAPKASHIVVELRPRLKPGDPPHIVYYDGVTLAEGEYASEPAPRFSSPQGEAGTWAGQPFVNRLRNASAERTWPYLRPAVDRMILNYTRRSPSQFLGSLLDWERGKGLYVIVAQNLLQSFWARFGWNHIALPQGWYWGLAIVTVVGLAGAVVAYLRLRRAARASAGEDTIVRQWAALDLLAVATLFVWANAFLRVHPFGTRVFIPAARYAYPAIVPTVLALVGGWWSLPPRRFRPWFTAALFCGLLALDGISIWTVCHFNNWL